MVQRSAVARLGALAVLVVTIAVVVAALRRRRTRLRRFFALWRPPTTSIYPLRKTVQAKSVPPLSIRKGTGLGKDFDVYKHFMPDAELASHCNGSYAMRSNGRTLCIEHLCETESEDPIVFVPNQELLNDADTDALVFNDHIETVLCKSEYAGAVFRKFGARHGCTWKVRVFTFPPLCESLYYGFEKDRGLFFHPAGKSWMKSTTAVLETWRAHPEWPPLVVTCADACRVFHLVDTAHPSNVHVYDFLGPDQMATLRKHAGTVILPSACEGFGHSIHEACANGSLLITSNIPPVNEYLDARHIVYIEPSAKHPLGDPDGFEWTKTLSEAFGDAGSACFELPIAGIEAAVERALKLTDAEYNRMRLGSLDHWDRMVARGMRSTEDALAECGLSSP